MEQKIGNIFGFTGGNYAGNVYDKDHLSPTIKTMQGGSNQPMIVETNSIPKCLNPKGGRSGIDGLQPSVQDRVYSVDGISTSITTSFMPSIMEDKTIVSMRGRNPTNPSDRTTKQGYIECDVGGVADFSYPDSKTRRGRVQDNGKTCPTLTAESQDICKIEKVGQISNDGSQYGTVIADNGLSPNLVAGTHGYANSCIATQYRIRKLTPRECWRLMDFSDEDFEKAAEVNSDTQLYKQSGNSIVVNVLVAILGQLFPGKENVYKELSE